MKQRKGIWVLAFASVTTIAFADGPIALPTSPDNSENAGETSTDLGGRFQSDLIWIRRNQFSIPLRFGALIPNSERIQLGSRVLERDRDYTINYEAGTIFLNVDTENHRTLTVTYRYDEEKGRQGVFGNASEPDLAFNLTGGNQVFMSFGVTERNRDGSVVTSNLYGLNNSFSFGPAGAGITGIFAISERAHADYLDLMDGSTDRTDRSSAGASRAIYQQLDASVLGGRVTGFYQNIDEGFEGFSAFANAGFERNAIDQLQRERGLVRSGFGLHNIGSEDLNFSYTTREIADDEGAITWNSVGFKAGPVNYARESRTVSDQFTRFQSLASEDLDGVRWQHARDERGMSFDKEAFGFNLGESSLSIQRNNVSTAESASLIRESLDFSSPWLNLNFRGRRADSDFNRYGVLRDEDREQLQREHGTSRQQFSATSEMLGGFSFDQLRLSTGDAGDTLFFNQGLSYENGPLSFSHSILRFDNSFRRLDPLSDEEQNQVVQSALGMYGAGLRPNNHDARSLSSSSGIERSATAFGLQLGDSLFNYRQFSIGDENDSGGFQQFGLKNDRWSVNFRQLSLGEDLGRVLNNVMRSESEYLGSVAGIDRMDFQLSGSLDRNRKLDFGMMNVNQGEAGISRTAFSYEDKGFSATYTQRSVEEGFDSIRSLIDPEARLLAQLQGFNQSELNLDWRLMPSLRLRFDQREWGHMDLDDSQSYDRMLLQWNVTNRTYLERLTTNFGRSFDGNNLNDWSQELWKLRHSFGEGNSLTLLTEENTFNGDDDRERSSVLNAVEVKTQITETTELRTEHAVTNYDTGERKTEMTNQVSQQIGNATGISVTESRINRPGDELDEVVRNYGFWINLGNDIRINYGFQRHMRGEDGTLGSQFEVTPGELGDIKVESAKYERERIDGHNEKHVGAVSILNTNPINLGIFEITRLNYSVNSLRDRYAWAHENRHKGIEIRNGDFRASWDYTSQIHHSGIRAIDRGFEVAYGDIENGWFAADVAYKVRTMPLDDELTVIRSYNLEVRPTDGFVLKHSLLTNPENDRNNRYLLGSRTDNIHESRWQLTYNAQREWDASFAFSEIIDFNRSRMDRVGTATLTLFKQTGSPLHLSYGLNQRDRNDSRETSHLFELRFDQRPGPNQFLSLALGNMNWQHSRPTNQNPFDWMLRLDYQLRW